MLELKKRPKSPFWYARGTVAGKRVEVSTKCKRLADAKAALPGIIAELCADTDDQQDELTFVRALPLYQKQRPDARFLDPVKGYSADKFASEITNAEMRKVHRYLSPNFPPPVENCRDWGTTWNAAVPTPLPGHPLGAYQ